MEGTVANRTIYRARKTVRLQTTPKNLYLNDIGYHVTTKPNSIERFGEIRKNRPGNVRIE